jgi:DNA-binding GntR family transcriptional regulator
VEPTLGEQAYQRLREMIVHLDLAPGDVLREDSLRIRLGIGRTPIREALQRLAREHFVTVIPRRGMFVAGIDVAELSTLFETRTVLEPYAARLAAARGSTAHWAAMDAALGKTAGADPEQLIAIDRACHELMWEAADNRFLLGTLDMLYAQSERLWHLYLAEVTDMGEAVAEHEAILRLLSGGEGDAAAAQVDRHIRSFDTQIRTAVTERLEPPLAG